MITVQMTIECPTDGQVTVDVGDVNAIVFDRNGRCEVSFTCPQCGRELRQAVTPVAMQMAIVESETGEDAANGPEATSGEGDAARDDAVERRVVDEATIEAYCEYFRQELAESEDIEAALGEFADGG